MKLVETCFISGSPVMASVFGEGMELVSAEYATSLLNRDNIPNLYVVTNVGPMQAALPPPPLFIFDGEVPHFENNRRKVLPVRSRSDYGGVASAA